MKNYIATCPRCGEKFASEIAGKRFLCDKCRNTKLYRFNKKCKLCGKDFKTNRKDQVYCSFKCSDKAKIKREKRNCKRCGKEFETTKKSAQVFCSNRCYLASKKDKIKERIKRGERIALSNRTKKIVKFLFFNKCFLCDKKANNIDSILVVHHMNKRPYDNRLSNLVLLCNRCHSQVHNNKETWRILKDRLKNKLLYKFVNIFGKKEI